MDLKSISIRIYIFIFGGQILQHVALPPPFFCNVNYKTAEVYSIFLVLGTTQKIPAL